MKKLFCLINFPCSLYTSTFGIVFSSFYIVLRYDNTRTTSDMITHRTELQGNEYQL